MPEPVVEIPNRPAFRASEVCELAQIPPYVLKSWEKEFPNLGTVAKPGGPRVYRRGDVEQVMKIKHLLFAEGLTLAGARRKLEGEPRVEEEPLLPGVAVPEDVRDKVARVKRELRSLLNLLSPAPAGTASPDARAGEAARPWPPVPAKAAEVADQAAETISEASSDAHHEDAPPLPLADDGAEPLGAAKPRRAARRSARRPAEGA